MIYNRHCQRQKCPLVWLSIKGKPGHTILAISTHESVASSRSEEICSCLKEYFEGNDIRSDVLIAISDNCGGQNKNWTVEMFWINLLATGRFKRIEQHFPLSGHSMLPSDRYFGHVEVYVKNHIQYVYTPHHWIDIITKSCKLFSVHEMTQVSRFQHSYVCHYKENKGF